jgi:hypothetical protein
LCQAHACYQGYEVNKTDPSRVFGSSVRKGRRSVDGPGERHYAGVPDALGLQSPCDSQARPGLPEETAWPDVKKEVRNFRMC